MSEQTAADLALAAAEHAALLKKLQRMQAALDALRAHHTTDPTMLAHVECLEEGLKEKNNKGTDLNAVGPGSGLTPLLAACLKGDAAEMQLLLAFGADPAIEGDVYDTTPGGDKKYKEFPLSVAARDGHETIVKLLLSRKDVDANQATTDTGTTALDMCCVVRNVNICKMLLARDEINVNQATTDDGSTPLYSACYDGSTEIVAILLARDKIDVNQATTNDGNTPLYAACYQGHTGIVTMLLARDEIDVNQATTDDGASPIYAACYHGHTAIVKMLLARDEINVNQARTDNGETPIYAACYHGHTEIVAMLLARDGIDVNQARIDDGATPLYTACYSGHTEVVKMLLARDEIDVNRAKIDDGVTPLSVACDAGHTAVVKMLLARNEVDVHKVADNGMTPLHSAALTGHLGIAQLLAVNGARLTAVDNHGNTAAAIAASQGQAVLAEWLTAVAGWSPLRVAAGCRLHKEAVFLLRRGKIDPDDPATSSIQNMTQVVATSLAKPAALPWPNAPPICKATVKLVADATRGWHRTTHWLHHAGVRGAVFAVMVVALRLEGRVAVARLPPSSITATSDEPSGMPSKPRAGRRTRAASAAADATAAVEATACTPLPVLPIEIWMHSMRFVKRSWWTVVPNGNAQEKAIGLKSD